MVPETHTHPAAEALTSSPFKPKYLSNHPRCPIQNQIRTRLNPISFEHRSVNGWGNILLVQKAPSDIPLWSVLSKRLWWGARLSPCCCCAGQRSVTSRPRGPSQLFTKLGYTYRAFQAQFTCFCKRQGF